MNLSQREVISFSKYLLESPWLTSPVPSSLEKRLQNISIEDIKKLKRLDDFGNYEIYEASGTPNELYFIQNDVLVSYYSFFKRPEGYIQTKLSWNNKDHNGSFRHIFGKYIIPKYKVVMSDEMMTPDAFNMWQKLIYEYPNYKFYGIDGDKQVEIINPYDVHFYKEQMRDNNSTFLVEYH